MKEDNKIRVYVKEPGRSPELKEVDNTLEALQKIVGGFIETVSIADNAVIICNEEGRLKDLPYNCSLFGGDYVGTIILAGVDEDEFDDWQLSPSSTKVLFPYLWEEPS